MANIFAPKTTRTQKVLAYISMLLLALMLVAVFSNTLVNDEVYEQLSLFAAVLSLLLLIAMFWSLKQKHSWLRIKLDNPPRSPIKVILSVTIAIPILLHFSLAKGLPVVIHTLLADKAVVVATIDDKRFGYYSRTCDGGLYLQGYRFWGNDYICGISKQDWDSYQSGDKLVLYGDKSLMGFTYQKYTQLTDELLQQIIAESAALRAQAITSNEAMSLEQARKFIADSDPNRLPK
ncbi:hypothetical protein L2719_07225 [Shewanella schlegeliana]|uniref:DUF308 domain-containing protein n=1 Tax=Shewanella schlegeliana TaxID=190308 RepID=A0ABS1SXV1_9GAMM|nr:hypothetical protein [Shewanella schlegeliana]MBL4913380.1 hypothetical protein [Shewanella schlegeliana]MCL1109335.1 hypothetical protein [Shewanella schlegeliana]GIU38114.1 hypothetical protein TUM4433_39330 [Shewanella schlegeliana]